MPLVSPVLKTRSVYEHIYASFCQFPSAMKDYVNEGVAWHLNSPEFDKLTQVIDPFEYRDRLEKTNKYMVNAVGGMLFHMHVNHNPCRCIICTRSFTIEL